MTNKSFFGTGGYYLRSLDKRPRHLDGPWLWRTIPEVLLKLLFDEKYCDLTIECEGQKIAVHKAVVCMQSKVMEMACRDRWKERKDGRDLIRIVDFDLETVRRMVEFLYTGDYDQDTPAYVYHTWTHDRAWRSLIPEPESKGKKQKEEMSQREKELFEEWMPSEEVLAMRFVNELRPHVYVYAIAEYYMIDDLAQGAMEKFRKLLEEIWWSNAGFKQITQEVIETTKPTSSTCDLDVYYLQEAFRFCADWNGPETLRDILIQTLAKKFADLGEPEESLLEKLRRHITSICTS